MALTFRRATEVDIPQIAALSAADFGPEFHDEADFSSVIRAGVVFVVCDGPRLVAVGQAFVDTASPDRPWEIREIVVHPNHRLQGLGRRLLDLLLGNAPPRCTTAIGLAVTEDGRRFAEATGFVLAEGLRFTRPLERKAA